MPRLSKRPGTVYDDKSLLNGVILPRLGKVPLGQLTRRDIAELHASSKDTPYRANRALALLHHMFEWASADDSGEWTVEKNPVDGVRRYHEEKRDRWLSEEELQRLADAMDEVPTPLREGSGRVQETEGLAAGRSTAVQWMPCASSW